MDIDNGPMTKEAFRARSRLYYSLIRELEIEVNRAFGQKADVPLDELEEVYRSAHERRCWYQRNWRRFCNPNALQYLMAAVEEDMGAPQARLKWIAYGDTCRPYFPRMTIARNWRNKPRYPDRLDLIVRLVQELDGKA